MNSNNHSSCCTHDATAKTQLVPIQNKIPIWLTIVVLLTCSIVSFSIGCGVRYYKVYKNQYQKATFYQMQSRHDTIHKITTTGASIPNTITSSSSTSSSSSSSSSSIHHPIPTAASTTTPVTNGIIDIPKYTFRNFVDTNLENTVLTSNSFIIQPDGRHEQFIVGLPGMDDHNINTTKDWDAAHPMNSTTVGDTNMDHHSSSSIFYEPSGQHLLVDITNVDRTFLQSEAQLTDAMMELIQQRTNMTLLSYHCHESSNTEATRTPTNNGGISCVGILLESHVSFHTFPIFGSISFDLFSCGPSPLLSLLTDIQELFARPSSLYRIEEHMNLKLDKSNAFDNYVENYNHQRGSMEENHTGINKHNEHTVVVPLQGQPLVSWNFKRRGFRNNLVATTASSAKLVSVSAELPDLHWMLSMGAMDKKPIVTVQTDYQRIDIYDMKNFHSRPPDQIDRIVFLDGIIQSRLIGEHAYHEALVHPVMICHDDPKRVIIIGGGEGATLREVLKHNTVEEVIMVEIDEIMVTTSQMYLPEWSTCANNISCFDDPRTTVYYTDAIAWFINRFGVNSTIYDESDVFDIIIMDALDPDSVLEFSDFLYKNTDLMYAFYRALGDDGIFVAQVGEVETMHDLPESFFPDNQLSAFLNGLESFGFESIVEYSESHGRFIESWGFIVAMKDRDSRSAWFRNDALINYEIAKRISPETPLLFFDGPTMMNYQYTSRINEEVWCRDKDVEECSNGHGFDPYKSHLPHTAFEVRTSTIVKGGRGVFAKQFVPKGTVIGLEECVNGMFLPSQTFDLIRKTADEFDEEGENDNAVSDFWKVVFFGYIDGYGWIDSVYGLPAGGVDPGIMTFVNHGCNSTYNVGTPLDVNEMTAVVGVGPEDAYDDVNDVFHPYNDRQFPHWECEKFVALRDIEKDEELFDNYLVFGGGDDIDDWNKNLLELRSVCMGKAGTIAEYEAAATTKSSSR